MRVRLGVLVELFEEPLRAHFSVRSAALDCEGHVFLADGSSARTSEADRELLRVLSYDPEGGETCGCVRKRIGISGECETGTSTDQKLPSNVRRHDPKHLERSRSEHVVPSPFPGADCLDR